MNIRLYIATFSVCLISCTVMSATTWTVSVNSDTGAGSGTSGDFRYCLTNAGNGDTILFDADIGSILLTSNLPVILQNNLTIQAPSSSSPQVIDGNNAYRIFAIGDNTANPAVSISSVSILRALAQGGNGGDSYYGGGGGGALGAGGALFIKGSATLDAVSVNSCRAIGGNGGNGGTITSSHSENGGAGGGGASFSINASNGENTVTPSLGGNGGGDNFGAGALVVASPGGNATGLSGGGGGGTPGAISSGSIGGSGGSGFYGGAGGGAGSGATQSYAGGIGGAGSFGAGGGGAGKGGVSPIPIGGSAGILGGNGGSTDLTTLPFQGGGGGGGAGIGGSIYVYEGSTLTLANQPLISNGVVLGGSGGTSDPSSQNGSSGSSFAPGVFLDQNASLIFQGDCNAQFSIDSYTSRPDAGVTINNGIVTLSQENSYQGPTDVLAGTLVVNGSITNSSLTSIAAGSMLKGTGSIGSAVIHGILQPGNSIGTITFDTSNGDVTLSSTATTNIEISPTLSSTINIIGPGGIALNGALNVIQDAGNYGAVGRYSILEGTYTGAFSSLIANGMPGFQFDLLYLNNLIYLIYQHSQVMIPTARLSGNNLIVANYLNSYGSFAARALVADLNGGEQIKALNAISPARNAFGTYITQLMAFSLSDLLTTHQDNSKYYKKETNKNNFIAQLLVDTSDSFRMKSKKEEPKSRFSAWISGFGEFAHQNGQEQNPSFNYNSEAIVTGVDYAIGKEDEIGGALGYAHSHFYDEDAVGSGNINYYFLSAYANFIHHSFYISPALWGIFNQIDNTRKITFSGFSKKAKANIFAWQLVPHLEIGYDFRGNEGGVTPFTSADWAISWQRAYNEEGALFFSARQSANRSSMVRSETGVKFHQKKTSRSSTLFVKEKIAYVFEKPFGTGTVNASFSGTPSSFTVTAVNRNLNLVAIGLDILLAFGKKQSWTGDVSYKGEFGSNYWSNDLTLMLSKNF